MTESVNDAFALFDDATWPDRSALLLTDSQGLVEARSAQDVAMALHALDEGVAQGLFVAGYCAYELGYCFEPRLQGLLAKDERPLIRFHMFKTRTRLDAKGRARWLLERAKGKSFSGKATPSLSAVQHRVKHEQVRKLIGDGDVYQVNLTMKLLLEGESDSFETYRVLREKARAGACAFLRFSDEDILSFSPELFFQINGQRIRARPMKGTSPRSPRAEDDGDVAVSLAKDEKQRAENLMIVDLLRNDLSRVSSVGSVEVSDLFTVETFPTFHTLTSGIQGTLAQPARLSTILPALFPCGSVTGAPKIRAMEIIHEIEDAPRGIYCGAIGYAANDTMAFNVAIRTISVREDRLEIGVGGGIVWDSEATSEYNECLLKSRFLTDPHEPFRLIETIRWNEATGFFLLERHLARMMRSSRYFGYCFDRDGIVRHLSQVMNGLAGAKRVRLTLGARGDTQVEVADLELHSADHFWRYGIASQRMLSNDWRIYHKTTRRELYDQGLNELKHRFECDEALFLNEREELTEGSRSNLFIERDGVWLTPPLSSGLLDGCLRRDMLESGDKRVVEQVLQIGDLSQGTVWFGNSLRGLIRGLPSSVQ